MLFALGSQLVADLDPLALRLADRLEEFAEPWLVDVEGLAALDSRERDAGHLVAGILVETCDSALAVSAYTAAACGTLFDQVEILLVRSSGAGEIAALLHQHLVCVELVLELLGEPLARVERVEPRVPEGVVLAPPRRPPPFRG